MNFNEILYGVAYYDEYMPYDRIETDFKMIRDAGMNVIRIAESTWSTWEPEEGVFDFTHLHRMLDCAAKYELKVIVGTPTYHFMRKLMMQLSVLQKNIPIFSL